MSDPPHTENYDDYDDDEEDDHPHESISLIDNENNDHDEETADDDMDLSSSSHLSDSESNSSQSTSSHHTGDYSSSEGMDGVQRAETKRICSHCCRLLTLQQQRFFNKRTAMRCIGCGRLLRPRYLGKSPKSIGLGHPHTRLLEGGE